MYKGARVLESVYEIRHPKQNNHKVKSGNGRPEPDAIEIASNFRVEKG